MKKKRKYTVKEERRLKEEFDKAQQQAQKTKEAYEKMLKEKKSTLKPIKKPQEDSSSEKQRVRQKKIEDSSSSEIPKRMNMKARCIMIRLRSAREVAEEGERPVLTERGGVHQLQHLKLKYRKKVLKQQKRRRQQQLQ
jgi:hypothetical protein